MANPPGGTGSSGTTLAARLALVFLAVALAAVALLAILTAVLASDVVSSAVNRQRTDLTTAVAVAASAVWGSEHRFAQEDLGPAFGLARRTGAEVQVRDSAGAVVAVSAGFDRLTGAPQYRAPVLAHPGRVGTVVTRFNGTGLAGDVRAMQTALLHAIAGAAGLAALLALVTGLLLARRVTGPVGQMIAVTRARGRGDRTARIGQVRAPPELRELATALDRMADTFDRQEQLRRDLVADVAHELRTPVAILQAGHEALLDGMAEPTPEALASLRDEVLRLGRMVTDLQELAAADAASLQLSLGECNIAEIAADAVDSLAGQFEAAGIAVERRLVPAPVRADRRWLHQIITNLLTNALKFTAAGGTVTIEAGPTGTQAALTVTDTGIGIPAEELPRIFDRFWRGRGAAQTSGSGVGLAVAAELTHAHGGELTARSEPGRTTAMTLTLPS